MNEKERVEFERLQERENKAKARIKRQNEAIKNKYDRISATLPKGTKEEIEARGESVNGLINKLVFEWINNN